MKRVRFGSGSGFCLQYWKAIFSATSTAVAPSSEKKTRVRPSGASSTSLRASSIAGAWVRPSSVACATRSSWSRIAASSVGWRWPWTLHQSELTPSR